MKLEPAPGAVADSALLSVAESKRPIHSPARCGVLLDPPYWGARRDLIRVAPARFALPRNAMGTADDLARIPVPRAAIDPSSNQVRRIHVYRIYVYRTTS